MEFEYLIERAKRVLGERRLSPDATAGGVSAALETERGNVYTGVCIDVPCGIGFCAEHAAIAAMVTAGESRIVRVVAVSEEGIVAPCGRCREFMNLIHPDNTHTEIMLTEDRVVTLKELLPFVWDEARKGGLA